MTATGTGMAANPITIRMYPFNLRRAAPPCRLHHPIEERRSKNGNPNRGSPHLAKLPCMLLGTTESAEIPKASQPATVG